MRPSPATIKQQPLENLWSLKDGVGKIIGLLSCNKHSSSIFSKPISNKTILPQYSLPGNIH